MSCRTRPSRGIPVRPTRAEPFNATLDELLTADRRVIVFGEDAGVKGGYTASPHAWPGKHGAARVFDTSDEQAILGLALGAGARGLIPIPEVQYLAYLHNAEDQLRGEAATLPFFSRGRFTNPMAVRLLDLATRKASAGTSTTTTPWRCCETFPASCWHAQHAPTTLPRCCEPASLPRSPTRPCRSFWNRSRASPTRPLRDSRIRRIGY